MCGWRGFKLALARLYFRIFPCHLIGIPVVCQDSEGFKKDRLFASNSLHLPRNVMACCVAYRKATSVDGSLDKHCASQVITLVFVHVFWFVIKRLWGMNRVHPGPLHAFCNELPVRLRHKEHGRRNGIVSYPIFKNYYSIESHLFLQFHLLEHNNLAALQF